MFSHVSEMYFDGINFSFVLFFGGLFWFYFSMKGAGVVFIIAGVNPWPPACSDSPDSHTKG